MYAFKYVVFEYLKYLYYRNLVLEYRNSQEGSSTQVEDTASTNQEAGAPVGQLLTHQTSSLLLLMGYFPFTFEAV